MICCLFLNIIIITIIINKMLIKFYFVGIMKVIKGHNFKNFFSLDFSHFHCMKILPFICLAILQILRNISHFCVLILERTIIHSGHLD